MPADELYFRIEENVCVIRGPNYPREVRQKLMQPDRRDDFLAQLVDCLNCKSVTHPTGDDWFRFLGERLFERFHEDVRAAIRTVTVPRLRVFIEIEGRLTSLATAPWELTRFTKQTDPDTDLCLGTSETFTLTRVIKGSSPVTPPPSSTDGKLRVVFVNCGDLVDPHENLRGEEVAKAIKDYFPDAELWDGAEFMQFVDNVSQNKRDLGAVLQADIIHILAHGESRGGQVELALVEGGGNRSAGLIANALAGRCRVVILQSCSSAGAAEAILERGADAVIAMNYPVERDASITFINTLYQSILSGAPVDVAVQEGRRQVRGPKFSAAVGAPVLVARDTTQVTFNVRSGGNKIQQATAVDDQVPVPARPRTTGDILVTGVGAPSLPSYSSNVGGAKPVSALGLRTGEKL
jgi:hypothetical protein